MLAEDLIAVSLVMLQAAILKNHEKPGFEAGWQHGTSREKIQPLAGAMINIGRLVLI